ncbi:MAG: hypothetical protein GXY50_00670 [Syntrophomonadaceae bacterium]|nr:hypothetical protein [Syntrophomonadaceae bacterium]
MRVYNGDLHVHIGRARGRPVKITASDQLTIADILETGALEKGLHMVGVVDCGSPLVLHEIMVMLDQGRLEVNRHGDLLTPQGIMLVLGVESESREGIHFLSYLPDLKAVETWQKLVKNKVTNTELSTQRMALTAGELQNLTKGLEGIFVVAHAFTPHKGAYGCWVSRLKDGFGKTAALIDALELGLSADTEMAGTIEETRQYGFLSNSDAHSLKNLGREYNQIRMGQLGFEELRWAIAGENGRRIMANYGMHPLLGKYHRSFCPHCRFLARGDEAIFNCPKCEQKMIPGVWDRIHAIRDYDEPHHPIGRPPYYYRVPLHMIPGIGPAAYNRLRRSFGSEIEIVERADLEMMKKVVKQPVIDIIQAMRHNELRIIPGGGGYYGRVQKDNGDI